MGIYGLWKKKKLIELDKTNDLKILYKLSIEREKFMTELSPLIFTGLFSLFLLVSALIFRIAGAVVPEFTVSLFKLYFLIGYAILVYLVGLIISIYAIISNRKRWQEDIEKMDKMEAK